MAELRFTCDAYLSDGVSEAGGWRCVDVEGDRFRPFLSRLPSCSRPSRTLRAAKTRCPSGLL